jgi:hypothetical protein
MCDLIAIFRPGGVGKGEPKPRLELICAMAPINPWYRS